MYQVWVPVKNMKQVKFLLKAGANQFRFSENDRERFVEEILKDEHHDGESYVLLDDSGGFDLHDDFLKSEDTGEMYVDLYKIKNPEGF